ncbi:unnamed protein product, partial [Phaeothamnion confervicola]
MHMDGNGSFCAAGGLKAGRKRITCVESDDALLALRLANFTAYAKPGGSEQLVNDPTTPAVRAAWRQEGVRFGTFEITAGDGYVVPSSVPHEFINVEECLSVAWNFLPPPCACGLALAVSGAARKEA